MDAYHHRPRKSPLYLCLSWLKDVLGIALIVFVFNSFAYASFYIPSGSMRPTLEVGDRIWASKFAYGYSLLSLPLLPEDWTKAEGRLFSDSPDRGDIVIFHVPDKGEAGTYIKRVIGLPGDQVQLKRGRLILNGAPIPRNRLPAERADGTAVRFEEVLPNGRRYIIMDHGDGHYLDDTPQYIVPEGHIFVMGDNRDNSSDSRVPGGIGFIPFKHLIGRAERHSFSLAACSGTRDETCLFGFPLNRFFTALDP